MTASVMLGALMTLLVVATANANKHLLLIDGIPINYKMLSRCTPN